jgi:hypothetical protein
MEEESENLKEVALWFCVPNNLKRLGLYHTAPTPGSNVWADLQADISLFLGTYDYGR